MQGKAKTPTKKMQNVDFATVDEFLDFLTGDELKMVELLRKIILSCMPECNEHLAYNVPFYRIHKNICFIWPGSVTWGTSSREGVRLGFTNGYLMEDEAGYLDKGERKHVYWKDFRHAKEIDAELLRSYLLEAIFIDQELRKAVNAMPNKKGQPKSK
ncbi:MAG: DUF1801 domain-containing protein [Bacteroidota bacterium]